MSVQEHPKYAKLVKRHGKVLSRLQRLDNNPRAQNLEREMQSLVATMAPLKTEANRRIVLQVKHSLDSIEKQIKVIEREPPAQVKQPIHEEPVLQNHAVPLRVVHPVWQNAAQRFEEQLAYRRQWQNLQAERARQEQNLQAERARQEAERQREAQALLELELAAQREAEAAAQQWALQAEFEEQLNTRPVVFGIDPEGDINLRAFALDPQSVHRSSVQNSTHKAVLELLSRPAPPADQDTLPEIVGIFNTSATLRWPAHDAHDARDMTITELTDNYFNMSAFSTPYSSVLDYVWAYIGGHAEKNELTQRLAEELYEGKGMCSNGKMARLINILQGYDESLETAAPRELFQQRIAELASKPLAERTAAAHALFAEFRIPENEHAAWIEPLLD
jgi:hypothetical protein